MNATKPLSPAQVNELLPRRWKMHAGFRRRDRRYPVTEFVVGLYCIRLVAGWDVMLEVSGYGVYVMWHQDQP